MSFLNLEDAVAIRALDANGDPTNNAKCKVYLAGTTTQVTTYTDSAGGTANAWPVAGNASGAFDDAGGIYVALGSYKVDVTDSLDVSLPGYPIDDVKVISTGFETYDTIADVQAATIDASVTTVRTNGYAAAGDRGHGMYVRVGSEPSHAGKIQSADGAWFELVENVEGANPLQFGADPSGASASDTAFINCWAYCIAKEKDASGTRGVVMFVPSGHFLLTTGNVIGGTSQSLSLIKWRVYGAGHATIIHYKPTSAAKFSDDDMMCALYDGGTSSGTKSTLTLSRGEISDMWIRFDDTGSGIVETDRMCAARGYQVSGWRWISVEFDNYQTPASDDPDYYAVEVTGSTNCSEWVFTDCEFRQMYGVSINRNPQAVNHEFIGCHFNQMKGPFFTVDGGAMPSLIVGGNCIWDSSPNIATITGSHDGSDNVSVLSDSTATFPTTGNGLIGARVTNDTDGSTGFVISNTATTVTTETYDGTALQGGTDDDWDDGDTYTIYPPHPLIEIVDDGGLGTGNFVTNIHSIKPEMRSTQAALVVDASSPGAGAALINFYGCNWTGGGIATDRVVVAIGSERVVSFQNGSIADEFQFMFLAPDSLYGNEYASRNSLGHVTITDASINGDLSTNIVRAESAGRLTVVGSTATVGGVAATNVCYDIDNGAKVAGPAESAARSFAAYAVKTPHTWTSARTFDLVLPYGAQVDTITTYLPGAGADATSRTITIADGDATTLATAAGAENADIQDFDDLRGTANGNVVRTTTNQRTLTVSVDTLTQSRSGGWVKVEYH